MDSKVRMNGDHFEELLHLLSPFLQKQDKL